MHTKLSYHPDFIILEWNRNHDRYHFPLLMCIRLFLSQVHRIHTSSPLSRNVFLSLRKTVLESSYKFVRSQCGK